MAINKKYKLNKLITIIIVTITILSFILPSVSFGTTYPDGDYGDEYFSYGIPDIEDKYSDGGKKGIELAQYILKEVERSNGVWQKWKPNTKGAKYHCIPREIVKSAGTWHTEKITGSKYFKDGQFTLENVQLAVDAYEKAQDPDSSEDPANDSSSYSFDISDYTNGYNVRFN